VIIKPAATEGLPAHVNISPVTAYAQFINNTKTGPAGSRDDVRVTSDVTHGDGTRTVTFSGNVAADSRPTLSGYRVPQPSRFAEIVFTEALHERGIAAAARLVEAPPNVAMLSPSYTAERLVAEHVSPPFAEEVKITLKVSHNLHASATPFLLGALLGHKGDAETGFDEIRKFLDTTGADVSGASQSDGAGAEAHFTPDFMVHYLAFMAKQPAARLFHDALPILGTDGTLWNIQTKSPAVGHVHAKTGTYAAGDLLHKAVIVTGKGLAGYMTTTDGRHLAFAIFANNVPVKDGASVTPLIGDALGEIATAAYESTR
jgi:D-alanyl-D-alanine carboxypeptidase/D-alanyl-D-alanine-endopeptidase (penicillin-binding protein 4)